MWVGAPVPLLPQLPIEEHGRKESAYLYTTPGRVTAVARRQAVAEKSNMRCPALSDGLPTAEARIRSHW